MIETIVLETVLLSLTVLIVWLVTFASDGFKASNESAADYYAFWTFAFVVVTSIRVFDIERKIDEMNQCGPPEVTVSDE